MSTIDDYARDIIERLRSARRKETANVFDPLGNL
jgi:hypothetical protein